MLLRLSAHSARIVEEEYTLMNLLLEYIRGRALGNVAHTATCEDMNWGGRVC
jgi:hypothetical protein